MKRLRSFIPRYGYESDLKLFAFLYNCVAEKFIANLCAVIHSAQGYPS